MGVVKLIVNGTTKFDITGDTVAADKLMAGYTAHGSNGNLVTGTASMDSGNILKLSFPSFSSLPITASYSDITADHVVIESYLSNPAAQTSAWTVTTTSGSLTVSGTISGSTTLVLILAEPTSVNVTL